LDQRHVTARVAHTRSVSLRFVALGFERTANVRTASHASPWRVPSNLAEGWSLRSADALHIASAAEWSADLFVSADEWQCAAARGYGLQVEELPAGLAKVFRNRRRITRRDLSF
jgi:predicted nucleic acid-binding protein